VKQELDLPLKLVGTALEINDGMPNYVANRIERHLRREKGQSTGTKFRVLLIGISYKPNISDTRESPALKIWERLKARGFAVTYHDPFVPSIEIENVV
jgi:UDP-N-acetyl-D-glucosamine dehydrogenase